MIVASLPRLPCAPFPAVQPLHPPLPTACSAVLKPKELCVSMCVCLCVCIRAFNNLHGLCKLVCVCVLVLCDIVGVRDGFLEPRVLFLYICQMWWTWLFMHCITDPEHPSLLFLMAVTAKRSHWRATAWAPLTSMMWWGTASAETAWLSMRMAEENSARTVHLSESILDPSTEALSVSPVNPAQSRFKARLQLKCQLQIFSRYF